MMYPARRDYALGSLAGGLVCLVALLGFSCSKILYAADAQLPHATGSGEEGGEHVHGVHIECPHPRSPLDTLRCAQENHPAVKRAKLGLQRVETLSAVARQIPNPELETQAVFGKAGGDSAMQTQVSLTQPIEWGGQRSARGQVAKAQEGQVRADLKQVEAEVILQTVNHLYRLAQIEREREIMDEAIGTFSKLVAQYRSRPRLAPEQEVSLTVFQMAESDSRLKMSTLTDEEREIGHYFHLSTGLGLSEVRKALPKVPQKWPDIKQRAEGGGEPSPSVFRVMSERDLSLAELTATQSSSWPALRVGPMLQLQREGPFQGTLYGFQLNIDLPVFNLNGASRAHATRGVEVAEGGIALLRAEESHERAEQVRIYRSSLEALKTVATMDELERKHQRIEALIVRGLVSSSLAIEAHRQRIELEHSRNERELKAIQALWNIYKLDGRIFQESL